MSASDRHPILRLVVGIALPVSLVVLTLLPLVLFRDRFPEPLATHWGTRGRPNGSMTFPVLVLFNLVFAGTPAALMALAARRAPAYRGEIAPAVGITTFAAAVTAIVSWFVARANLDAAGWSQAAPVGLLHVGLAFLGAAAMATLATVLGRSLESDSPPEPVVPRAGLRPGMRGVWTGTAQARWVVPFVIGFVAGGVAMAIGVHPVAGLPFGLLGLVAVPFLSIRVTADRRGVRIAYGPFGWPVQRIPLADIRQASAITVNPMRHGGWGYRGSLRLFGRAAVVLRTGEGIRLDLSRDRVLVITVDGAHDGAGLLNDLVAAA